MRFAYPTQAPANQLPANQWQPMPQHDVDMDDEDAALEYELMELVELLKQ